MEGKNNFQMTRIKNFAIVLLSLLILTQCSEETQKSMGLKPIPNSFGDINEVVIVADRDIWEGSIGDTLDFYYSSAYPILPQPEPMLDLRHFTPEELDRAPDRKELRNYMIVANLNDSSSPTTQMITKDIGPEKVRQALEDPSFTSMVGRDKWAKGQLIIYQFGNSQEALINNIKQNLTPVLKRIRKADSQKIDATIFFKGESFKLMSEVKNTMGLNMRIPDDFFLAMNKDGVMWMRKETDKVSSNIMITKRAYKNENQLTKEYIKSLRDSLGRYISTEIPNTYMKINDQDLPMLAQPIKMGNQYTIEARGIWEIVNDYMGGAFVSYLIHNPVNNELIFVDGFVHAPGENKRDHMQALEHIINTIRL
jgi:hypothetical protein